MHHLRVCLLFLGNVQRFLWPWRASSLFNTFALVCLEQRGNKRKLARLFICGPSSGARCLVLPGDEEPENPQCC